MTEERFDEPSVMGVDLARYAAVCAGLAEDLPLDKLLENERIEAPAWPSIERGWTELLAADVEVDGVLVEQFDAAMREATQQYRKPLPPLDGDLGSWYALLQRLPNEADPASLLERVGITATDFLRLQAHWSRKLDGDPELVRKSEELLKKEPGPLPRVKAGAVEMKPPFDGAPVSARDEARAPAPPPSPQPSPLPPMFAPLPTAASESSLEDPTPVFEARHAAPPASVAAAALPFRPPPPPAPVGSRPPSPLPFRDPNASSRFVSPPAAIANPVTRELDPHGEPGEETMVVAASSFASALPFRAESQEAQPGATAANLPAPVAPPSRPKTGTVLGETVQGVVSPFVEALPFAKARAGAGSHDAAGSKGAAAPRALPAGFAPEAWSIEKYASLCAELAVFAQDQARIFDKYGLTVPGTRDALDAHFRGLLGRDQAQYQAWTAHYWRIHAYWSAAPRR